MLNCVWCDYYSRMPWNLRVDHPEAAIHTSEMPPYVWLRGSSNHHMIVVIDLVSATHSKCIKPTEKSASTECQFVIGILFQGKQSNLCNHFGLPRLLLLQRPETAELALLS